MAMSDTSSDTSSARRLGAQLAAWTAQGLIDEQQAARIRATQAAPTANPALVPAGTGVAGPDGSPGSGGGAGSAAPRRLPLVVEALGYVGAVFAVVAGFIAVGQLWPAIPAGAELAFAGVAAAVLLAAGAALHTGGSPAFGRLRSALWLASAASVTAFAVLLTGPHFWQLGPAGRQLATEAGATAYAAILWWHSRAVLQHLAVFTGLAALTGTAIVHAWPADTAWRVGLGLWLLALLWAVATHRGYLVPRTAGYAAAGIGLIVGAQLTIELPAGQVIAVATVAGLLSAGVALRRVLLLALGAVGAIDIVPQVATRYLPQGAGAAVAVFVVGLIMLGVALWLAKARKGA